MACSNGLSVAGVAGSRERNGVAAAFGKAWSAVAGSAVDGDGEVAVGLFDIHEWADWHAGAEDCLDDAERRRVARLRDPELRVARTRAYALHRLQLGHLLAVDPEEVPLYRDSRGCPQVAGARVWTSLSHAGNAVAVAVSTIGPIGIDVEPEWRRHAMPAIAERVGPRDELATLPTHAQAGLALLRLWVAKEALLKAAGIGLALEMDRFSITDMPRCAALGAARNLLTRPLDAGEEWIAALATQDGARVIGGWIHPVGCR